MAADSKNSNAETSSLNGPDRDASAPVEKPIPEADPVDIGLLAELRQARKDRVAQIKAEIDAGTYESEELLDAAMDRLVRGFDMSDEESEEEKS